MVVHVGSRDGSLAGDQPGSLDKVKGAFLASLNHEIRTPLSGIVGMLDLLSETQLDEDQRDYLSAARMCADSLSELLNSALQYSALAGGQFVLDEGEFSLREALEAALAPQRHKAEVKNLKLSLSIDGRLPETMLGDAPRLRELVGHLLANAIKFTHAGSVELHATLEAPDGAGEWLIARVTDTGIGIPDDRLDTIFESFRQIEDGLSRAYPGLGLGLALASKMTAAMGGEITVESQLGAGSTFTVRLPLRRPAESPAPGEAASPVVLAVDDNPVGLRVLRHVLERRQLRVVSAASGREAIQAAGSQQFDLILMDLQMPDIDGLRACSEIRRLPNCQGVPILALTANCSDQVRDQCRAHGMQAFLSKPIDAKELWSAVTRYLPHLAGPVPAAAR